MPSNLPPEVTYDTDEQQKMVVDKLDYDDLCRLSRLFNERANLAVWQDERINEWLKRHIAAAWAALPSISQVATDDLLPREPNGGDVW